ncbi:uncharacterized protein LOC106474170 isoform X3 [Limulus polyphemus]|uniref:Uncharacterized protein LOC106474170 isoform X3 n=1 Tax=Limulus polyphemus TaxID=6850 RepID=A0ABM1RVB5_LIMPO|nr:uncharacterized protein LOC106474170 isoform X3 [Limulus polyphemus]
MFSTSGCVQTFASFPGIDQPVKIEQSPEGLILQCREVNGNKRVGQFIEWPSSMQPLMCDEERNSSVTHVNMKPKTNLSFVWETWEPDLTDVQFVATFITSREIWEKVGSKSVRLVSQFPLSLQDCATKKSCVCIGKKEAKTQISQSYDYVLTFMTLPQQKSIGIAMGGILPNIDKGYLAVAFTADKEKLSKLTVLACFRSGDLTDTSLFVVNTLEEKPVEKSGILEEKIQELYKDHLWCQFTVPMSMPGNEALHLEQPLYQVYFSGKLDDHNGIILPPTEKMIVSNSMLTAKEIMKKTYTLSTAFLLKNQIVMTLLFTLLSLSLLFL